MRDPVSTRDTAAVRTAVLKLFQECFPTADPVRLIELFDCAVDCFAGRYPGYQAVDALYHDLEHTLQGTLCLARLLAGRQRAGAVPPIKPVDFQLAIIAALLHDTGYLKAREDKEGTGAKYTLTHVMRSAEFAGRLLGELGFPPGEIRAVQNMIRCTGVNADLGAIAFQSELERTLGYALATADLLGQMAAEDYPEKLPLLFDEFVEAARFNGKSSGPFASVEALIASTPGFWENYVLPKINREFQRLYCFLESPSAPGRNDYIQRIEANIQRVRRQPAA